MRGASCCRGRGLHALLRYANGAFGPQRRLSGKGSFVNLAPLTMEYDPATGLYTSLGETKRVGIEATWTHLRDGRAR
jgi:hypothetical protein